MIKEKSGTTLECLEHYFGTLPTNQKKIRRARQPFCDFVQCTHKTAARWRAKRADPLGISLVLVRLFLQDHGYDVKELKDAHPLIVRCNRAIAAGVVQHEKLQAVLGYANSQDVFRVLQHRKLPVSVRMRMLEDYLAEVSPEKDREELAVANPCRSEGALPRLRPVDAPSRARARVASPKGSIDDAFVHQVLALLPLANYFLSDDVNDEKRKAIRERFTRNEIFDLSNVLGSLCSTTARNDYMEERSGNVAPKA